MATTKADICNLALGILLLNKEVADPETDQTIYGKTLRKHWDRALRKTLSDLDLERTAEIIQLELVETDPVPLWGYAYKYPDTCALLRRIESGYLVDNRATFVDKTTGTYLGEQVIFTNQVEATASIQSTDVELDCLGADAEMALACALAGLCSNLIVGKGASKLREEIRSQYIVYKAEAQENDNRESFNPVDPETESEFAAERMS